jgi:hypothetical protein
VTYFDRAAEKSRKLPAPGDADRNTRILRLKRPYRLWSLSLAMTTLALASLRCLRGSSTRRRRSSPSSPPTPPPPSRAPPQLPLAPHLEVAAVVRVSSTPQRRRTHKRLRQRTRRPFARSRLRPEACCHFRKARAGSRSARHGRCICRAAAILEIDPPPPDRPLKHSLGISPMVDKPPLEEKRAAPRVPVEYFDVVSHRHDVTLQVPPPRDENSVWSFLRRSNTPGVGAYDATFDPPKPTSTRGTFSRATPPHHIDEVLRVMVYC